MDRLTIAHVILNRFLKQYNERIIKELPKGHGCMDGFGYENNCEGGCKECYELHPREHKQINSIYNNLESLENVCRNTNSVFKPTDEYLKIMQRIQAGEFKEDDDE